MNLPIKKLTFSFFAMLIAVSAYASQANADVCKHIDEMAVLIQRQTRALQRETVHYRYTPQYRKLVVCVNELQRLATHIHEVTHFEGNLDHLKVDLRELDREFHQIENLFDRAEVEAARGCSRIRGNTAHVKRLLNAIENAIHHIQDDVDALIRRQVVRQRPVYVPTRPVYVPTRPVYVPTRPPYSGGFDAPVRRPGSTCPLNQSYRGIDINGNVRSPHDRHAYDRSGSGFSIGGGSTRIHFRF